MGRKRKFRQWALLEDGNVVRYSRYTSRKLFGRVVQSVQAHTLVEAKEKFDRLKG